MSAIARGFGALTLSALASSHLALGFQVGFLGKKSKRPARIATRQKKLQRRRNGIGAMSKNAEYWCYLGHQDGGRVGGKTYSAKQCYEEALKINRKHDEAWFSLGVEGGGTVGRNTYSKKQCYEEALKFNSQFADAWTALGVEGGGTLRGETYSKKQCFEEALKFVFERIKVKYPKVTWF